MINSSSSKRYVTNVVDEVEHVTHKVVNSITNEIIYSGSLRRSESIADAYNHFYCKPDFPNKYFVYDC